MLSWAASPDNIVVWYVIGAAAWGIAWYLLVRLVQCIVFWGDDPVTQVKPVDPLGPTPGPLQTAYCQDCGEWLENAQTLQPEESGKLIGLVSCPRCNQSDLLPIDWFGQTISLFLHYTKYSHREINPKFPIKHYLQWYDWVNAGITLIGGVFNAISITYAWVVRPSREADSDYNFTTLFLIWSEFILLAVNFGIVLYESGKFIKWPRVALGRFIYNLPRLQVNALSLVSTCWDPIQWTRLVRPTMRSVFQTKYRWTPTISNFAVFAITIAHLPLLLVFALTPVVAIFVKINLLKPVLDVYVAQWTLSHWVKLLQFLNNIRSTAKRRDAVAAHLELEVASLLDEPFHHLLRGGVPLLQVLVLWITSPPKELFELFVLNESRLYQ